MSLKRKAYEKLLEWKKTPGHKPLIVEGLRQVGKSYLVLQFARENYENVIVFDFRYDPKTRDFFQGDLVVDEILRKAYPFFPKASFAPGKTVIIFEEIGDCPAARASLKPFYQDGRFDIIATGSLLGVANYRRRSKEKLPTGYEEFLKMYPLDFEEFLWAIGASEAFINTMRAHVQSFAEIPESYAEYGRRAIKAFMLVGGMPDAVNAYIESGGDLLQARRVQASLLHDYEGDFGRYIDDRGEEKGD